MYRTWMFLVSLREPGWIWFGCPGWKGRAFVSPPFKESSYLSISHFVLRLSYYSGLPHPYPFSWQTLKNCIWFHRTKNCSRLETSHFDASMTRIKFAWHCKRWTRKEHRFGATMEVVSLVHPCFRGGLVVLLADTWIRTKPLVSQLIVWVLKG